MELRPLRDHKQVIGVMGTVRENVNLGIASPVTADPGINRVFERVTDAFIALDKDWKYTYLNSKAEELHGLSANELIGKNIWEVFPDVVTEPFFHSLYKAMETQQPMRVELFIPPGINGLRILFILHRKGSLSITGILQYRNRRNSNCSAVNSNTVRWWSRRPMRSLLPI